MQKVSMADRWSPNAIQDLSVARQCDRLHATLPMQRITVIQERVEHVTTRALAGCAHDTIKVSIRRKLLGELEAARRDSFLDYREMLTGAAKIRFRGRSVQRR
jgi:hypothetical protein